MHQISFLNINIVRSHPDAAPDPDGAQYRAVHREPVQHHGGG